MWDPVVWSSSACAWAGGGGSRTAPGFRGTKRRRFVLPLPAGAVLWSLLEWKTGAWRYFLEFLENILICWGLSPVGTQVQPFCCSSSPGLQFPKEIKSFFLAK